MKKLLLITGLLVSILTGCTQLEEPEQMSKADEANPSVTVNSPQTRAGAANVFGC